jgi:hypothetical protein
LLRVVTNHLIIGSPGTNESSKYQYFTENMINNQTSTQFSTTMHGNFNTNNNKIHSEIRTSFGNPKILRVKGQPSTQLNSPNFFNILNSEVQSQINNPKNEETLVIDMAEK